MERDSAAVMWSCIRVWNAEQRLKLEREGERAVRKGGGLNRGRRAVTVKRLSSGSLSGALCGQRKDCEEKRRTE